MSSLYNSPTTPAPKPQRPWFRRKRFWVPGGILALVVLGSAVGGTEDATSGADAKPQATKTVTASPSKESADETLDELQEEADKARKSAEAAASAAEEKAQTGVVPDVVGKNHADALTILHTAGFMVNEEDASPEGRMIILNSGWKVCSQEPEPGTTGVLRVTINSVKNDESC